MEACVVFCRMEKPAERRGRVLFINAVGEYERYQGQSSLSVANITRVASWYFDGKDVPDLVRSASIEAIASEDYSLGVATYTTPATSVEPRVDEAQLAAMAADWTDAVAVFRESSRAAVALCRKVLHGA